MVKRQHILWRFCLCLLWSGWLGSASVADAASPVRSHRAASSKTPSRHKKSQAPSGPTIQLEHLTTHDSLALHPSGSSGGFGGKAMKSVSRVLRCHHTGKRHAISSRLVNVLYSTARHFHSKHIFVVAGYRAPAVARKKGNPKSAHKRGVACDFRLDGVRIEAIRDYLRDTYHNVGVGYYPNSGFIHVDVGRSRAAYWIDYSAPGEKAQYASPSLRMRKGSDESPASAGTEPAAPTGAPDGSEEPGG